MSQSPFKRATSPYWYVRRAVRGLGELTISTHSRSAAFANQCDRLVLGLRDLGRLDALRALKEGRASFAELLTAKLPSQLDGLLSRVNAPPLRPLVDEWMQTGAQDMGLRDRTMRRYSCSWRQFLKLLPGDATLGALTPGFVADYRRHRREEAHALGISLTAATVNRDLAALGAFRKWCREQKDLRVDKLSLRYNRESSGRMRWLTQDELARFRAHCPAEWEPLFALLFGTGMTISEALGLRRADISLTTRRVQIHESYGRQLKRASRARELSIPIDVARLLTNSLRLSDQTPSAIVFATNYQAARKAWRHVCASADIYGATIHDARHTYAVHAVQSGIPEARLQRLLGHSHPGTTRRYAMHAPEQFLDDDADRVARHMSAAQTPLRIERGA
jgi:integrase